MAEKYKKELEKELNVKIDMSGIDPDISDIRYLTMEIDGKYFQAGSFDSYFYSNHDRLSSYLYRKEIQDVKIQSNDC